MLGACVAVMVVKVFGVIAQSNASIIIRAVLPAYMIISTKPFRGIQKDDCILALLTSLTTRTVDKIKRSTLDVSLQL